MACCWGHDESSWFLLVVSQNFTLFGFSLFSACYPWHLCCLFYSIWSCYSKIMINIIYFVKLFFRFEDSSWAVAIKIMAFIEFVVLMVAILCKYLHAKPRYRAIEWWPSWILFWLYWVICWNCFSIRLSLIPEIKMIMPSML